MPSGTFKLDNLEICSLRDTASVLHRLLLSLHSPQMPRQNEIGGRFMEGNDSELQGAEGGEES